MNKLIWGGWILFSTVLASYYFSTIFFAENKSELLIGEATHGHFQIELACASCHTQGFGGDEIIQKACESCHAEELEAAHDSHPKKRFTDPRNADRIEIIDARYCVSCHTEHQKEQTRTMGVTLPDDYCYHCHENIGKERESHQNLPFDSCASAGCHNYHDNRALYEEFLTRNADQPWLKAIARINNANAAFLSRKENAVKLEANDADAPLKSAAHPQIKNHWAKSRHADAGINCSGCHNSTHDQIWVEKPEITQCEKCHSQEIQGFLQGKHGMRLSKRVQPQLSAIKPKNSLLEFKQETQNQAHSCTSCHSAHEFNTQIASTQACLNCHNDEHSLAFLDSPHGKLWQQEKRGEIEAGQGVSCATCHMPRLEKTLGGKSIISVQHNQNENLRPNEKMIRPVCMSCHGLEFALDALADPTLIKNNFSGKPTEHIESVDWAKRRIKQN